MSEVMQASFLSVSEAAQILGVSQDTVRRRFDKHFARIDGRKLKPLRISRTVFIDLTSGREIKAEKGPGRRRPTVRAGPAPGQPDVLAGIGY